VTALLVVVIVKGKLGSGCGILLSGKGNRACWSDHGKAFVVTCSGDGEKNKKYRKETKLLRSRAESS
jgi:hypothetical protein